MFVNTAILTLFTGICEYHVAFQELYQSLVERLDTFYGLDDRYRLLETNSLLREIIQFQISVNE